MLKILMLVVILLTAGFGIQYSYYSHFKSAMISHNEMAATAIFNKLKAYAVKSNNDYLMPLGVNDGGYHQLPAFLPVSRVTQDGTPFVYCPFSNNTVVTGDSVIHVPDDSYSVNITNSSITKNLDYVSESEASPVSGVLAVLIAPEKPSSLPNCLDLIVDSNGRYSLGGDSEGLGRVYVLTIHDIPSASSVDVQYVAAGGLLSDAIQNAENHPENNHLIVLQAGETYALERDFHFQPNYVGKQGSVVIRGESDSNPSIISAAENRTLSFSETKGVFENLSLDRKIGVDAYFSDIAMVNVSLGLLSLDFSSARLSNVTLNSSEYSGSALVSSASSISADGTLVVSSENAPSVHLENSNLKMLLGVFKPSVDDGSIGIQVMNSDIVFDRADIVYSVPSGVAQALFYVDGVSEFVSKNGSVYGSGSMDYGIYNLGEIFQDNYTSKFGSGVGTAVFLAKGSRSAFSSAYIGSSADKVNVGIYDDNASSVVGEVGIYALTCISGDGFSRTLSDAIIDNEVVEVRNDFSLVVGSNTRSVNLDATEQFNSLSANCL